MEVEFARRLDELAVQEVYNLGRKLLAIGNPPQPIDDLGSVVDAATVFLQHTDDVLNKPIGQGIGGRDCVERI